MSSIVDAVLSDPIARQPALAHRPEKLTKLSCHTNVIRGFHQACFDLSQVRDSVGSRADEVVKFTCLEPLRTRAH